MVGGGGWCPLIQCVHHRVLVVQVWCYPVTRLSRDLKTGFPEVMPLDLSFESGDCTERYVEQPL